MSDPSEFGRTEGSPHAVLRGNAQWCVVNGDCVEVLGDWPDGDGDRWKVDHVLTDPPYSEWVHGKSRAGARKTPLKDGNGKVSRCAISREVDFGFEALTETVREFVSDKCAQLTRRWVLVFSDVESAHLWRTCMEMQHLDYCRTGAWIRQGATPQFTGDRPAAGFEAITICHAKGRKRWNGGGSHAVWTHLTVIERGGQRIRNNERVHPTQKPLSLMLELVELFTDPGDVILDPFCGSGTTLVAALRRGRRAIGIEQDATFATLARERCLAEEEGLSLSAARAGQMGLF